MHEPLLTLQFEDGSLFSLPQEWEDAFVDYFGPNPAAYPAVAERLRFLTCKYVEHQAWPSKFDGLPWEAEERPLDDTAFDDPEFYWESWSEWGVEGIEWGARENRRRIQAPPTWAQVAEAVTYQELRAGLLQKALQQLGARTRVVTPKQLTQDLANQSESARGALDEQD